MGNYWTLGLIEVPKTLNSEKTRYIPENTRVWRRSGEELRLEVLTWRGIRNEMLWVPDLVEADTSILWGTPEPVTISCPIYQRHHPLYTHVNEVLPREKEELCGTESILR